MVSQAGKRSQELGVELPTPMDKKFALLEKLIELFKAAKNAGDLDNQVARVKKQILIVRIGCTEEAANSYIKAALDRC